ncbi:hypothetical protein G7078_03900 [Sphingomonas sinipercae]|uniref:Uncharacterized protein n=1 Tax=Sphingomonas sinipercae TaxID=2714944 RepID=A0A6G7ZM59_9SPHN|nr:hypothetical protein [Sphingomonas sinipercae]QIL02012.1 hypothetical protein G7078_03900 [Sphingomonas sinipercae]
MKIAWLAIPFAAAIAASPANATGGLVCRTAGTAPVDLSLVIGHAAVSTVVSARLTDNGRGVAVRIGQAWIDPDEVRLDLVDPRAMRHEARLVVKRRAGVYDGSLWRGGKRRWIRCREG